MNKAVEWVKNRIKERTSLDGAVLVAAGGSVLLLGPLADLAPWAMVAYGAWTIWKSEK